MERNLDRILHWFCGAECPHRSPKPDTAGDPALGRRRWCRPSPTNRGREFVRLRVCVSTLAQGW